MLPAVESLPKPKTPLQLLKVGLVIIRGGTVNEDLLHSDVMAWMGKYGFPTWESVEKWAEGNFELEFAMRVLIEKEPG